MIIKTTDKKLYNVPQFVRQEAVIDESIPIAALFRLEPVLVDTRGDAHVRLAFSRNSGGRAEIKGIIQTKLALICQRCYEEMLYPIDIHINLTVVRDDEEAKDLIQDAEPFIPDEEGMLDLYSLVEEEILLSIPVVVKHDIDDCPVKLKEASMEPKAPTKKKNPFDVLKILK